MVQEFQAGFSVTGSRNSGLNGLCDFTTPVGSHAFHQAYHNDRSSKRMGSVSVKDEGCVVEGEATAWVVNALYGGHRCVVLCGCTVDGDACCVVLCGVKWYTLLFDHHVDVLGLNPR